LYLSRIEVNPRRRQTMLALSSPQIMHAALESSFPKTADGPKRNLWRVDKLNQSLYVLLQSRQKPDFTHIVEQFGWPAADQTWETKAYDAFLARLQDGQTWRFRLRANPVHSVKEKDAPGRGRVLGHITVEQQKQWLSGRATANGFNLDNSAGFDVVQRETKKFTRSGKTVTLSVAAFEGVLLIENAETFVQSLLSGIGRAKAYGCGLMTLARL